VVSVVWFKRDLRVADHRPLARAAQSGPTVALYVYEPELIAARETDPSHYAFVDECLAELERALEQRGVRLTYRYGAMPDVLERLYSELGGFETLYAHEETGGGVSFARDRRVQSMVRCAERCVARNSAIRRLPAASLARRMGPSLGSTDERTAGAGAGANRRRSARIRTSAHARRTWVAAAAQTGGETRRYIGCTDRARGISDRTRRRISARHV